MLVYLLRKVNVLKNEIQIFAEVELRNTLPFWHFAKVYQR